jgi:2-dehydropantoate 2-reductase
MRITIIGPGALGLLLAALLGRAGHDVWLLDHDYERAAYLAARGIWLEETSTTTRVEVRATNKVSDIRGVDLVLLCVKSATVAAALEQARLLLTPDSLLITFQNGLSHLDLCKRRLATDNWAVGITALGATLMAPDRVRHGGHGLTRLGFLGLVSQDTRRLSGAAGTAFQEAGMVTELKDDMLNPIWRKLLVNVGINGLTALHDCANGRLRELPELREQLTRVVLEGAAVARAKGIDVGNDPVADVLEVCQVTKHNISSMLQDIRCHRPTEIGAINGALVVEAHRLGLAVPVNEKLVRAVREKEREYLQT